MISFYELLGMIKKGTQPKAVEYNNQKYVWGEDGYLNGFFERLEDEVTLQNTINGLTDKKEIKILQDCELSNTEKLELEKTLKPFKKEIKSITKRYFNSEEAYYILEINFNKKNKPFRVNEIEIAVKEGTYEGLHLYAKYTPEELGLWEGEYDERNE